MIWKSFFIYANVVEVNRAYIPIAHVLICAIKVLFGIFTFINVSTFESKVQTSIFIFCNCVSFTFCACLQCIGKASVIKLTQQFFHDLDDTKMQLLRKSTEKITYLFCGTFVAFLLIPTYNLFLYEETDTAIVSAQYLFLIPELKPSDVQFCAQSFGAICHQMASFQHTMAYKVTMLLSIILTYPLGLAGFIFHLMCSAAIKARAEVIKEHVKTLEKEADSILTVRADEFQTRAMNPFYTARRQIARRQILLYDKYVEDGFRRLYKEQQETRRYAFID